MGSLGRREFIAFTGGAAVAWAMAARAQQPGRTRRIGWLVGLFEQDPEQQRRNTALVTTLRELGWTVGGNLQIDYRYLEDRAAERFDTQAAELVTLAPDVLLANST